MQILTGQYSKLYTYKYRLDYTDFAVDSQTRQSVTIEQVPRAVDIIGAKVWVKTPFAAPGLASCFFYVLNGNNATLAAENGKSPVACNVMQTATDFSGQIGFNTHVMGNYLNPNDFIGRLVTNAISGGAAFTAGEIDVWIITTKLP